MSKEKLLYRYEIYSYTDGKSSVNISEFKVDRETDKSYIVDEMRSWGKSPVISKTARKRFAYPTKEEALESLKQRKKSQLKILTDHLERCEVSNEFLENKTVENIGNNSVFPLDFTLRDLFK